MTPALIASLQWRPVAGVSGPKLRPYQSKLKSETYDEWNAMRQNVLAVAPTGAGKTVILSSIILEHNGPSCTIAHRQELVEQISVALARNGVRHRIIGPNNVIRQIVQRHMVEVGTSYYDPNARAAVAGVDTVMSWCGTGVDGDMYVFEAPNKVRWLYGPRVNGYWGQPKKLDDDSVSAYSKAIHGKKPPKDMTDHIRRYAPTVTLWICDEAHHLGATTGRNKWMKATDLFKNAKGLGVTATPSRADGAGLGRHNDGVFDTMVIGPSMRDLIDKGYLTEYRIFAPPSSLDMSNVKTSAATGDFNVNQVRDAVEHSSLVTVDDGSKVVGDVVEFYIKRFKGMLSVVFVPSVKIAEQIEKQFLDSGIPAKALDGNTPSDIRVGSIRQFAQRKLWVLINVALFDEGFDLPAIEVVQDAYPTQSYSLFCQRFGRMLRRMDGKEYGIYSDHACNVKRHGLPDTVRRWSLERRDKKSSASDATPLRVCMNNACFGEFERFKKVCPYCDTPVPPPAPSERAGPEFVDGDLYELDPETLRRMRGEVEKVDMPIELATGKYRAELMANHTSEMHLIAHVKRFAKKLDDQKKAIAALREIMAIWAGHHRAAGRDDSEIFRRFYLAYGVDWLSAQALPTDAALALGERVALHIGEIL
jgi:DNA repair protein RadD